MIKFFYFFCFRYCNALSYVAAFLAGVAIVVPIVYMCVPVLGAVVFGSLSAFFKRKVSAEEMRELAARMYAEFELSDRGID